MAFGIRSTFSMEWRGYLGTAVVGAEAGCFAAAAFSFMGVVSCCVMEFKGKCQEQRSKQPSREMFIVIRYTFASRRLPRSGAEGNCLYRFCTGTLASLENSQRTLPLLPGGRSGDPAGVGFRSRSWMGNSHLRFDARQPQSLRAGSGPPVGFWTRRRRLKPRILIPLIMASDDGLLAWASVAYRRRTKR
jgi:hypothetical protein